MNRSAFIAAFAVLALAQPAVAQSVAESPAGFQTTSRTVSLAGLRLTTPEGRRTFEARLDQAVQGVCGARSRVVQLETRRQSCARDALDGARAQIALDRDEAGVPSELVIVRDRRY